eukprot:6033312-Pleurochrysis_carterae.AAC.1
MSTAETVEETESHQTAPSQETMVPTMQMVATYPSTEETEGTTVATTPEVTGAPRVKPLTAATEAPAAMMSTTETVEEAESHQTAPSQETMVTTTQM